MDNYVKLRLKDWAEEDRPREKILRKGIQSLTNAELLAIIIGSGNREETVVELAQRILQSAENNLNQLGKYSIEQLITGFKGIGEAKAISIVAALELGKRRKASELFDKTQIKCSEDIFAVFYPLLSDLEYEEFWVLLLNRANKVIDKLKISQGGVSETVVDNRLIIKEAVIRLASGIALCHNHPSGNIIPSRADDRVTQLVKEGAAFFDIKVLDHLVISGNQYYSYADECRIL